MQKFDHNIEFEKNSNYLPKIVENFDHNINPRHSSINISIYTLKIIDSKVSQTPEGISMGRKNVSINHDGQMSLGGKSPKMWPSPFLAI
jgi:hypothetical protein